MSTSAPLPIQAGFQTVGTPVATAPVVKKDSGFVSFFKKIGSLFTKGVPAAIAEVKKDIVPLENIAQIVGNLTGNGAVVAGGITAVNTGIGTFESIFNTVASVEQIATALGSGSGTGVQKLTAALPAVEQAILSNPLFAGLKVVDLDKYNKAVEGIASNMVDLANSFDSAPTPAA